MSANNVKKKSLHWTMEEDEILIDFVKCHESLYNVKCTDFRNTQMKLSLWQKVGNMLTNKTYIDCTKRWAYIRDYYVRRKVKPCKISCGEAAKKRAQQMSFLDSCCTTKRSTITNIETFEENTKDVDLLDDDSDEDQIKNSTQNKNFISQSEMPSKEINIVKDREINIVKDREINIVKDREIHRENSTIPKKPKVSSHSEERLNLLKTIADKTSHSEEQDEIDLFFASMAKSVKKLSKKERIYVKLQISTIVGNAELRCLQQQNYDGFSRSTSSLSNDNSNYMKHYHVSDNITTVSLQSSDDTDS